jgi:hypothetical protein
MFTVVIQHNEKGSPAGKLADAELHFHEGPLAGLKLLGFAIWERRNGSGRNVTFPSRQYSVNGERRSFALLRPLVDVAQSDKVRDVILETYAVQEKIGGSVAEQA